MARALTFEEQERLTERAIAAATYSQSDVTSMEIENQPIDTLGIDAANYLDMQACRQIVSHALVVGNVEAFSAADQLAESLRSIESTPLQAVQAALINCRHALIGLTGVASSISNLLATDYLTSLVIASPTDDLSFASDRPFERLDRQRNEGTRFRGVLDDAWNVLPPRYRDRLVSRVKLLAAELDEDEPDRVPPVESLQHLVWFLTANPALKYPDIVLTPDGYFRAEWHKSNDHHLGVTFLSDGDVRFVVFAKPPRTKWTSQATRVERQTGITTIERLLTVLGPFGVQRWVQG